MKTTIQLLLLGSLALQGIEIVIITLLSGLAVTGHPYPFEGPMLFAFMTLQGLIVVLVAAYINPYTNAPRGRNSVSAFSVQSIKQTHNVPTRFESGHGVDGI